MRPVAFPMWALSVPKPAGMPPAGDAVAPAPLPDWPGHSSQHTIERRYGQPSATHSLTLDSRNLSVEAKEVCAWSSLMKSGCHAPVTSVNRRETRESLQGA
jgi:hypothetical protein